MENVWTADRRLYLDKAGKVVEEGDGSAFDLLIAEGQTMPLERAQTLGLVKDEKAVDAPAVAAPAGEVAAAEKPKAEQAHADERVHGTASHRIGLADETEKGSPSKDRK